MPHNQVNFNQITNLNVALPISIFSFVMRLGGANIVNTLIKNGANINSVVDPDGRSPLHYAALYGFCLIFSSLIIQ